jgi:DNA-binding NtrC family response regulator
MFKSCEDQIEVLGVCVDEPLTFGRYTPIRFHPAYSARRALESLRDARFDLLLLGSRLPDLAAWNFLPLLHNAYPRLNWVLVGSQVDDRQKSIARTFGALAFFDSTPSTAELLNLVTRLRQQAIENVLSGRFDQPAGVIERALAG